MEVEEVEGEVKIARVIFREFDNPSLCNKNFLNITLTKFLSIPLTYRGPFTYGHAEILNKRRSRFGIRKENPNMGPVTGVYLISQLRGVNVPKNKELLEQKYKLVFAFILNNEQEKLMDDFMVTHRNEMYSGLVANWNIFARKVFGPILKKKENWIEKLMINDYDNQKRMTCRWDCISLTMRCLRESNLIPEFRKNGKKVPLLGLTPHDAAMLLLDMYNKEELLSCKYTVSRELTPEVDYKKQLELFYEKGCKIIRSNN